MKKVLFVITRLGAGGAPSIMLDMLYALREDGYDVELATGLACKGEKDLLPEIQNKGFKITVISQLVRNLSPWNDIVALQKLWKLMKGNKYDVVHTHTIKAGVLGRLAAKLSGVPHVIHSPHGHIFHGYINPAFMKLYVFLERFATSWSQKIITLTHKEKEEYLALKIGKPEQFQCIYNGIEVEKYANDEPDVKALRRQIGIPESAVVLTTVGRLAPIKGHVFLLEAIASVVASLKEYGTEDLRCLIVGDGSLKDSLWEKAKELGISKCVMFLGYQEDVARYLQISDVFILPSLSEGFGLVVVEAMACGLPIVATCVDGVPEIVIDGETGKLVAPKDSHALANGILALLKNREQLKSMGERNRQRAKREFSLEQMNAQVKKLYEEVLAEK